MENQLTATYHIFDFNKLSSDKFSELCYWLVEDSGDYRNVEYYEGTGDKKRDIIGHADDGSLDYFQCKRYGEIGFSILKKELDDLLENITKGLKKPRQIFFVTSSEVSADTKDKTKAYAESIGLTEPIFWGPITLDRKVKNNPRTGDNFFHTHQVEELLPEVDIDGQIAVGTTDTRFTIANTGEKSAIECTWSVIGFNWIYKTEPQEVFNLDPGKRKELRISIRHDFMKLDPPKELRIRFEYRDNKNNWYYSERLLDHELCPSKAFYVIKPNLGVYISAKRFHKFSIDYIDSSESIGFLHVRTFHFKSNEENSSGKLKITISDFAKRVFSFDTDQLNAAFDELAKIKIDKMIDTRTFESQLAITQETLSKLSLHNAGFDLYRDYRNIL